MRLSQETIARILSFEGEAARVHDDAQRQAAHIIEGANKAAVDLREQALTQAHQQAQQITAEGQKAAQAERARIIAQAEVEAQRMETMAARHFDHAMDFVLNQVTGRE
jgi:vacuolar-type H+-ATPase subunit H